MDRKLLFGLMLIVGIGTPSAWPEASARRPGGEAKFTPGWVENEPTLRAEARGVKFFKRIGRDRVVIRLEVPGDVVELEASTSGAVRLVRKGRLLQLRMNDSFDANVAKVQKLLAGSKALDGFDGMVASLAANEGQQAQSLRSSQALINAVRGVTTPAPAIGTLPPATARNAMFRTARNREETPSACWAEYASTVNQYNVQFNECISSYWWIPGWTAACGFQFALQGELAFFWLISCSGGMPV